MTDSYPSPSLRVEPSLTPDEGWHCSHLYYRFDRTRLEQLTAEQLQVGRDQLLACLDPHGPEATQRLQTSLVSGHKADFGLMLMDPDPLKIDQVHQRLSNGRLGPALIPTYSFVSFTEISEYVPSVEQYAKRLLAEGEEEGRAQIYLITHKSDLIRILFATFMLSPTRPIRRPQRCPLGQSEHGPLSVP